MNTATVTAPATRRPLAATPRGTRCPAWPCTQLCSPAQVIAALARAIVWYLPLLALGLALGWLAEHGRATSRCVLAFAAVGLVAGRAVRPGRGLADSAALRRTAPVRA